MSNVTLQKALNTGYTVLDQKQIAVGATATQITAVAGTNRIIIKIPIDISGGIRVYLGASSVTVANGYPVYSYTGSTLNNQAHVELDTSKPEDFYMISNVVGPVSVSVLYLKLIE